MNDRFRFRVVNNREWDEDYGKLFYNAEETYEYCNDIQASSFGALLEGDWIVEQCTGLKDKNGELIYEGDIVKIPDNYEEYGFMSGEKREVYFKEGGFRLKPKDKKFVGYWLEDTKDFEIIGNIHENPELLEADNGGKNLP